MSFTNSKQEFQVRYLKCAEPILIRDESKTEEENKILRDSGYPAGYDELLDNVFPPEEFEENGKTWRRVASTDPTNRKELLLLEKDMWAQMDYWQTNNLGLCQIRRELYFRFFDELIRQVCILNCDLGELLIRIRDEFKSIIDVHINIFEDIVMTDTEKIIADGQVIDELHNYIKRLKVENNLSKRTLIDANRKLQHLKENLSEELSILKALNSDELNALNKNHEAIKKHYNILLTAHKEKY